MNESPPPDGEAARDTSKLSVVRLLLAAAFLGMLAVIVGLAWKLDRAAPTVQGENVELKQQLANMQEMLADLRRAEQLRMEEEQVRRSDLQAVAAAAADADAAVTAYELAALGWGQSTGELLAGEAGRAVAAHPESLARFRALRDAGPPGLAAPATLRLRLEPLRQAVEEAVAANDASYAPGEQLLQRLGEIRAEAARGADAYGQLNQNLSAIVASAPPAPADGPATLEAALEEFERRLAAEEAGAMAEVIERERKDRAEQLARERAESERQITAAQVEAEQLRRETELTRLADEKEAAMARAGEQEAERAAAQERAELERRFRAAQPEIQSLLAPFLYAGYSQPSGRYFTRTSNEKKPVSLGRLRGEGFLENTPAGVSRFMNAVVNSVDQDRPLGGFPSTWTTYHTDPWFEPARRAQELLRDFGPLMVEKGMLEP